MGQKAEIIMRNNSPKINYRSIIQHFSLIALLKTSGCYGAELYSNNLNYISPNYSV